MIKYGIFIQGGESMKKIISLALATLLCAMVFVGCGSGESKGATEPYSASKFNMLHDSTLPLDCSGDVLKEKGYKFTNDSGDNAYTTSVKNIKVGNITLSGESKMLLDSTNTVFLISYSYSNSTSSAISQLSTYYGSYIKDGSHYTWTITLPDKSEWIVELYDWSNSSNLSETKDITFYDKNKYDQWMDEYYKEEANKLTSQQKAIIKQAIEVADLYLDFELEQEAAESRLETLNERYEKLAKEDDIIGLYVSSLHLDVMVDRNYDHDNEITEQRNFLASLVGISER